MKNMYSNNIYTNNSFQNSICSSCHCFINEETTLRIEPDILLHRDCLICYQCGDSLANEESCFVKFSRIFCYSHYRALFSKSCCICHEIFKTTDFVLPLCQDNYCHAQCLLCTVCGKKLTYGCKYTISNLSVVCEDCIVRNFTPRSSDLSNIGFVNNGSSNDDTSNANGDIQINDIDLLKGLESVESNDCEEDYEFSDSDSANSYYDELNISIKSVSNSKLGMVKKTKKPPRNRTVLSEKQLNTLQTYYQMNPKPDALTKEQVMEATGLKQKVINVWFQNKRCKEKKRRISEELNKNKSPRMLEIAELMLTESPIEYDPQVHGIEIEKVFVQSNQFLNDSSYVKSKICFAKMVSDNKTDQTTFNRCIVPLLHSVSSHNQYSNASRLH